MFQCLEPTQIDHFTCWLSIICMKIYNRLRVALLPPAGPLHICKKHEHEHDPKVWDLHYLLQKFIFYLLACTGMWNDYIQRNSLIWNVLILCHKMIPNGHTTTTMNNHTTIVIIFTYCGNLQSSFVSRNSYPPQRRFLIIIEYSCVICSRHLLPIEGALVTFHITFPN